MITRIWHGKTKPERAKSYLQFLLEKGTDEYRQTDGNRAAKVWKKTEDDACHFWTVTEWDNLSAVKEFAGQDFEKAVYYPEDDGYLLEFEEHVNHYESYDVSNTKVKNYISKFEQVYGGGNWLAENFEAKLNAITEKQAFARPIPGVHSVAEIIWHCIYWRTVLLKRIEGNLSYRSETVDTLNFLTIEDLQKKGWPNLLQELSETQCTLLKLLSLKNDSFLELEYEPGHTYDYIIEGTLQHDLYHLGQIGLVLKILKVTDQ